MVSYADFITLMFAFFVVMFASSQTDKARAQQVSDSVKQALDKGGVAAAVHEILGGTVDEKGKGNAQMKGPGGSQRCRKTEASQKPSAPAVAELLPSMQYLSRALETEIRDGKIEIHFEPRGLVVSLRQATFFPSGEDSIDPKTYPAIEKIAQTIARAAELGAPGRPHRFGPHSHRALPQQLGTFGCPWHRHDGTVERAL